MAIVWEGERGAKVENVLSTTMTCTVTTAVPAGHALFVLFSGRAGDAVPTHYIVTTDSRGNKYETDITAYDASANDFETIISSHITTSLQVSDVVTLTFGWSVGGGRAVTLQEFSGIRTLDKVGSGGSGGGGAVSYTTRGATDTADELVIASITGDTGLTLPWTVGAGYSEFTTKAQSDGVARTHYGEYKIVSSTGVQTVTATHSNDGWHGVVATYRLQTDQPVSWWTA